MDHKVASKAGADDFAGRFREIVSDPLNLLIERHPLAGVVEDDLVYLHNGNRVPVAGPSAYYGPFSAILVINRGVHEPLEEYVFQELLKVLPQSPSMIELGAYWGHYSMWLKKARPTSTVYLVEPEKAFLNAGVSNFRQNGYAGTFVQAFVGKGRFEIDAYFKAEGLSRLDVLHADIQGYEVEMLDGGADAMQRRGIDYFMISTHSQALHDDVADRLESFGYRVEVSSDFEFETTAFDGFVFASSPSVGRVFNDFDPLGRVQITHSRPSDLVMGLAKTLEDRRK